MIKVLLVDDQPLLLSGFQMIIDAQPDLEVVGQAKDGVEAIAKAGELRPDVVLMDVRMPRLDGIEATERILETIPEVRVLVLTTFDLDEYALAALRAGASGFLLKDTPPQDLLAAIRAVSVGDAVVAPTTTRRLLDQWVIGVPETDAPPTELADLTDREQEVLLLLARGLSNSEIAEKLVLAEGTVKIHVSRILNKLNLRDRVQAVVFAYEKGLIQPGDEGRPQDA